MLRGIDISNHQAGFQVPTDIDFCICKATEGTYFVDKYCDGFIQDCINKDILFGYYHFANDNPVSEARFFWNNTLGYAEHGIPVIDYEYGSNGAREYLEAFCNEYHSISNVWPVVYISALSSIGNVNDLQGSWVPEKCGLWLAGYPEYFDYWPDVDMPYSTGPWEFAAIWQFTDNMLINGFRVDADYAFMDREGWMKYAQGDNATVQAVSNATPENVAGVSSGKTCMQIAREVLAGKWGVGKEREKAINAAFPVGTYEHVQSIINEQMI